MISELIAGLLLEAFPTFSVTHGAPRSNVTKNFICVTADVEGYVASIPDVSAISIMSEGVTLLALRTFFRSIKSVHIGEQYIQSVTFRHASDIPLQVPGGQSIPTLLTSWLCLHD